ncbi:phosphatidylinositol 4-kinase PIK1alpha [Candida albicans Ca6]|nr:phosphatidylinositol 4-kinase PIK1alpha [Candida albicans Ca6]KHC36204.1 phosphatidylinositol 4-kinase PIK1alpha [Candida albicans Ca6]KHC66119.1 phosphatidylinositol 4-kinase PIK1alpha [Candida albicans P75016]
MSADITETPNKQLLEQIRSPSFSLFNCIYELKNHTDSIGIQHELVKKLYSFPYEDLQFFIPQFVQLLVTYDSESMALEEFIITYSSRYPHFSLIVFWNLQAYIFELKNEPESRSFQAVRNLITKIQNIMFNADQQTVKAPEFRENFLPALVLCGAVASSVLLPSFKSYCLPMIKAQGKQQKSLVFKLVNFQKSLTKNLTLKNQRMSADIPKGSHSDDETATSSSIKPSLSRSASVPRRNTKKTSLSFSSDESEAYTTDDDDNKTSIELEKDFYKIDLDGLSKEKSANFLEPEENLNVNTAIKSKKRLSTLTSKVMTQPWNGIDGYNVNSQSLPDLSKAEGRDLIPFISSTESETSLLYHNNSISNDLQKNIPRQQKFSPGFDNVYLTKLLQVNYAKNETQFIMALQNISIRLSQVPKEARLSALRAELSIINDTLLPSEIDIPQLLPITSNRNKKYHKILKLNVNEASVLNSAERVPFLLFIEYLSDEIDFNPTTEYNQRIIARKKMNGATSMTVKKINSFSEVADGNFEKENKIKSSTPETVSNIIYNENTEEADLSEMPLDRKTTVSSDSFSPEMLVTPAITEQSKLSNFPSLNTKEVSTKVLADQMRIAAVMLQQLDSSGKANSEQSFLIKNRIVESMIALQDQFDSFDFEKLSQLQSDEPSAGERKLENDFKLGEDWNTKKQRIKKSSAYGHLKNWDLCSVIAKNGDDLPQEAFACQLISMISNIWKKHNIPVWTKRMKILITSANTGLVETITNAMSIHSIKKSFTEHSIKSGENSKGKIFTLLDYFHSVFGSPNSTSFRTAQQNFAKSLAAYSIICYVLQIKDRHNGNIMVDGDGHIIHIDFGFLLSNSPGSVGFEAAPFKLTVEYVELLGGVDSEIYSQFVYLCKQCFKSLRDNSEEIIEIVELMQKDSTLPCFNNGENTSVLLKQRLQLQLNDEDTDQFVENFLIGKSLGSMYTRLYDQFQMITQGIYS